MPLIENLIRRGICAPNPSKPAFLVNERFETREDCFLMGPLIAGNLAGKIRVWHADSCVRIIDLSHKLAEVLLRG